MRWVQIFWGLVVCSVISSASAEDWFHAGLIYDKFDLTLAPGKRTEIIGPLFYSEHKESQRTWAIPPLTLAYVHDPVTEYSEFDFAYPILTYDRFGAEYQWHLFQLLKFAGGHDQDETKNHRFTLFPIYFQQRSTDPSQDYLAIVPFYGHLQHRLFRDDIKFVLFPLYSKTQKKDIVTYNMPYPFFHERYGNNLRGWQLWPIVGHEHKGVTSVTNSMGETNIIGAHEHRFILWPFFIESTDGIDTPEYTHEQGLIPFYSLYRSKLRDSTSYGWPLGVTHTVDREKKYVEWDAPWPLVEFAHGEGKTEKRVWPFFNVGHNKELTSVWYAWPIYRYNRVVSPPLDRERTRILFFLYSGVNVTNTESGRSFHRQDLWPIFTHRHEFNGDDRLQIMAILEPIFPNNKSMERDYSPLYSFWRSEKSPKNGATSQSFLWNLYRRDTKPGTRKISLLFGLFQYQSNPDGRRWCVCYIPVARTHTRAKATAPEPVPANESGLK